MTKIVTHINCNKDWWSQSDWDSHKPCLWVAVSKMDVRDAIYEFGSGDGSTNLLASTGRWFNSYETNKEWADKFIHTVHVDSYFDIPFPSFGKFTNEVGVLFVDSAPAETRKELIEKWRNKAKVIVAHDTEIVADYVYGMKDVLSSFKYRVDYQPEGKPATTIVSDFFNVTEWI